MPRLIWSPAALRDVARLHRFLAADNPAAARRAVQAIQEGVKVLAIHPEMGRPIEDMDPEFREWVVPFGKGGYIAFYRHAPEQVLILAVRHGREAGY